jgi:hypothetical protein
VHTDRKDVEVLDSEPQIGSQQFSAGGDWSRASLLLFHGDVERVARPFLIGIGTRPIKLIDIFGRDES